jgi:hypothetical protein
LPNQSKTCLKNEKYSYCAGVIYCCSSNEINEFKITDTEYEIINNNSFAVKMLVPLN